MSSRRILLIMLFASTLPRLLTAGEGQIRRSPNAVTGEYIVVLNDDVSRASVSATVQQLEQDHGGSAKNVWRDALKGYLAVMTEAQAQDLSHNPQVKYIEENAEMFYSATVPTNVDPHCDPPLACSTGDRDNRLWHLDVLDQNSALASHDYSYCSDGTGVYVYVIDMGVLRAHREFNNDANRVVNGKNASGDGVNYPAYDPCRGALTNIQDHGTGVASLVAGRNVGVARNAVIVPIKVARCKELGAPVVQRNTFYPADVAVRGGGGALYTSQTSGTTGPSEPPSWVWDSPDCCTQDGGVSWKWTNINLPPVQTVGMFIEAFDWIVRPFVGDGSPNDGNPYPKSPAVVTISTYRIVGADDLMQFTAFEEAVFAVLKSGITVVASANNQDADACNTSPSRLSRDNPNNLYDPQRPFKVITAGGTMIRNNPDPNPATGGTSVQLPEIRYDPANPNQPGVLYNPTKPTLLARWRCHAGDSDICSGNIYAVPPPTTPPVSNPAAYGGWQLGSNGGRCVTLFAPAKNIPVATTTADASGGRTLYRNTRITGGGGSGTSWSTPIVVARILQNNPTFTVDQVFSTLMSYTSADLDPTELNPPGVTGTPNALLHIPDVTIAPLPNTITGPVTASATGSYPLAYQWYVVNSDFNVSAYHANAGDSTLLAGATSATLSVNPATATSYFVRVSSSCGSADSNITTFLTQVTPAITWLNPANIVYGTPLSATQLNASSTVAGTFAYTPAAGTILSAGTRTLSVTFTPTDPAHYTSASKTVTLVVQQAVPVITWAPAGLTYGTALGSGQLNAASNTAGTFTYSPAAGTVLNAGTQTLTATFTPTDSANYNTASGTVSITVVKATPTITWSTPSSITYGTALGATQLNASATVAGTFTYSPATGTFLGGGDSTLSVSFSPTNSANYNATSATVTQHVNRAAQTITWATPATITNATPLSATQLNATVSVVGPAAAGAITYDVSSGTVLSAGDHTITATAAATANYNSAQRSVVLHVCGLATIDSQTPNHTTIGDGGSITLSVSVSSTSTVHYQWYDGTTDANGTPVGTDSASFNTGVLSNGGGPFSMIYRYWVVVTNDCGQIRGSNIDVIVAPAGMDDGG